MKRERAETPSQEEEIARLEEEIAGLKALLWDLEGKRVVSTCNEVQRMYPLLDDLRKEITCLKSSLQVVTAEVCDLKEDANLEFQHVRGNQMAIQKVADTTGNHHIDTEEEWEMYDDERYQDYFMTCFQSLGYDAAGNRQATVSDPQLGS